MKKILILVVVAVLFSSCTWLEDLFENSYEDLEGSWLVVEKPEGWPDHTYVFTADEKMEIYYLDAEDNLELQYRGSISAVTDDSYTSTCTFCENTAELGKEIEMYYTVESETRIQIGWEANSIKYELTLEKKNS